MPCTTKALSDWKLVGDKPIMRVMSTPRSVEISITSRCNLRCAYCSHFSSPGDVNQDLPKEEWVSFFEELGSLGIMDITLEGGEPFIRQDLPDIIEGIIQNRMRFTILSNGTLITGPMAAFLASTRRCNGVQISIDGASSTPHDAFRGEGNFNRALNGLSHLQRHQVPASVRVTIHRLNALELEETARFLLEEVGLHGFSTNAASYLGLCRQNTERVGLTVEERSLAMEALVRLNEKYHGRISGQAGPVAEARMWGEMVSAKRQGLESLPGRGYLTGCGGVFAKIGIIADGTIVPCIQLSHMALGRINRDDLKAVWQGHPELLRLRRRREIPLSSFDFCKGCEFAPFCTGNCPALAYTITGEENHPSPDACLKRFLEQGGRLPFEGIGENKRVKAC